MKNQPGKKQHQLFTAYAFCVGIAVFVFCSAATAHGQVNTQNDKYQAAISYEQSGYYEKARDIFLELFKQNPDDLNSLFALGRILTNSKEYDLLIDIMSKRVQNAPMDYNSWGLLGNAYYLKGNIEKASEVWGRGIEVQPKNIAAYRVVSSYAIQNRAYETAIGFYKKGEKELGQKDLFINEKYNLYNAMQKYSEAAEMICEAILTQPNYAGLGKSVIYSANKRDDICEKYIEVINRYYAKSNLKEFKELLAFIYQAKGEDEKAIGLMKEIDAVEKKGNSFLIFAQECFNNRNYRIASIAYRYLLDKYGDVPSLMTARIFYPQSLECLIKEKENSKWREPVLPDTANNRAYEKVIEAYRETAGAYPETEYKNEALLKIGVIQKDILLQPDKAENTFSEIIKGNAITPVRMNALQNLAELKLFGNKSDEARRLLGDIIKVPFADSLAKRKAHFYIGKSLYWQGAFNEALGHIDAAAYDFANDLSNDAIELSALINACLKDSAQLFSYAKADFLCFQRKYGEAPQMLKTPMQSENQILAEAAKFKYGEILVSMGKYPESIKIMEEISTQGNSNYADNAYFSLGNIYYHGLNDFRGAKECFEKLLINFPESIYTDRAREMINTIKNKLENNNDNQPHK
jgi:tetratricopeptide (TPR) repeat protein